MIVVHTLWEHRASPALHIWAEASVMPSSAGKQSAHRGRQPTTKRPQPHPFALAVESLRAETGALVGSLRVAGALQGHLTLRLPSAAHSPAHSPELLLDEEAELEATALQAWEVDTLRLEVAQALDLLLALPDHPPHGVAYGSSLRYWSTAARFAYELIARQCYMPALDETLWDGFMALKAAWESALSPDDATRMHALARMMPPICMASLAPDQQSPMLPSEMTLHFLNQAIDAFVRGSISAKELLPPARGRSSKSKTKPLPEQWLRALASDDPILSGPPEELKQFFLATRAWLQQVRSADVTAPFRTCFRLDSPGEDEEDVGDGDSAKRNSTDWRISFHLQANDDRSLLVPAEQVWKERSSTLTFLKRAFENPQERLLADLGKASRLFPAIEESLKTAYPSELHLQTEQAYAFLRESAPLLEQSGFGVLVPTWWQKAAAKLGVKLHMKPKVGATGESGLLGLDSIISYDWTVSVGESVLTAREFESLVSLKMPLVKVRGKWVELRPEEIDRAIAFFQKKRRAGQMSLGEALRIGLGQEMSEVGLPVNDIDGEGWIKDALDSLSNGAQIAQIAQPASLQGQLRPYQLKGVSWLAFLRQFGLGSCLADDMGLGKTIQMITLMLHDREIAQQATAQPPTLLICPMSIVGNWHRELQRFAPSLRVMIHHGHERLSGEAFAAEARQQDMVITTYALALRDKEHLALIDWDYLVLDEAQNIKNEVAKQTMAIKSLQARHKIALTGTPVENRLSELWSIMEFLNPGYLGAGEDFRKRYAIPIERYHDVERGELLKRIVQPFVLRRLKTDKTIIADLPDKMEMKVFCNLTQEQATLYEAVVKEMMEKIEQATEMERRGLILATLMKLKQICNHPAQFMKDGSSLPGRSGKLERLEEMLEEVLAGGDKALIFSQFSEMGGLLRHHLQETLGCEVLFLHGGTPKHMRDSMVQRFQQERPGAGGAGGAPIFILSVKAGGVGLNLTAANHVFHFDRWWNPAVENQATDRAFRIGQMKNVQVHKFVCVGTLEERIDQMIEKKKELAENIVGSGENWLTEMSTTQLKELFALSREAVAD